MAKYDGDKVEKVRQRRLHEEQNLFSRLPATYAASRKQGQQILQRAAGLSVVEWRTLWDLSEAGTLTIRELAEIQRADHSLLSRALPAMQKKGLVSMQRDAGDGRQTIVALTDAGRAAYKRAAPSMKRRRDALREQFTPEELTTFVDYLDRLEAFLRQPIDDILYEKERVN
ncbi:MarR family winged helix-turn-helix transcriptional regulator [Thalassococcus lentus]|uniref:MarR family transcriptional regulator n=1 Tax=Thalassococcus lentus TaxID=1210524 RepID=A0ABT4XV38_9RHOB|nr:MarR family transcriptional regulator [Thalassococcus lentus]MDA7425668.1 MarR family transcriptional regulator [Thalassococcus lentus]